MSLTIFNYENTSITFQDGDSVMINATEMAKPFGKKPVDWIKTAQTQEYIDTLSKVRIVTLEELVCVQQGGNNPGTWFNEDVALEFARWLSPKFAIWCNDRIKELLRHGVTASPEMLLNPDMMIKAMEEIKKERAAKEVERAARELAEQQLSLANNTIIIQAPKVEYYNKVLQAQNLLTTNMVAADLGMSAIKLNEFLIKQKIIYKQGGVYMLYSNFRNAGYADYKTHTYNDSEGKPRSTQLLCWTEAGRKFIIERVGALNSAAVT